MFGDRFLNPKNGRPGSNFVCLALVLIFWIQINLLFKWYSNGPNREQLIHVFGWFQTLFKRSVAFLQFFAQNDWWHYCNKTLLFFSFFFWHSQWPWRAITKGRSSSFFENFAKAHGCSLNLKATMVACGGGAGCKNFIKI